MQSEKILDEDYNKIIGLVLKEKRTKHGYSLTDLSKKLNNKVTRQGLSRYENNTARIKVNLFCEICKIYGEDVNEVIEEISLRYLEYVQNRK